MKNLALLFAGLAVILLLAMVLEVVPERYGLFGALVAAISASVAWVLPGRARTAYGSFATAMAMVAVFFLLAASFELLPTNVAVFAALSSLVLSGGLRLIPAR